MSRPLRSAPITGTSALLRAGPPSRPPVLSPEHQARRAPCRRTSPMTSPAVTVMTSHVPRGRGRPGSRRLYAGHRLANQRAPARLIPGPKSRPGFDVVWKFFDMSAAIHSRSPSRSPPDTSSGAFSSSLTTPASRPTQHEAVWSLPPQGDSEGPTFIDRAALDSTPATTSPKPPQFVAHLFKFDGARHGLCLTG
jgi:hypothetical protein